MIDGNSRKRKHYLVSSVATLLGLSLLMAGFFYLTKSGESVSYAIGGGLLVAGVIRLFETNIYVKKWEYERGEEIADEWGILDIQEGRGMVQEEEYTRALQNCDDKLHIQAVSLTRFRKDMTRLFEEKAKYGVEIRLLLLDPDSQLCEWYDEMADISNLDDKIRSSVDYYQSVDADNLEVRYYDGLLNNYFRVDDEAFIGPYFIHTRQATTVTFLTDVNKDLGKEYKNNFEKLWQLSRKPSQERESQRRKGT